MQFKKVRFFLGSLFLLWSHCLAAQTFNEILGRPTDKSVTVSVLFDQVVQVYFEYGPNSGAYLYSTPAVTSVLNTPVVVDFQNLEPNTRYYYRTVYKKPQATHYTNGPERSFHTQRTSGTNFRFDIEADEHLYDKKGIRSMFEVTLANQARDSADFLITLGDIYGDDHTPTTTTSAEMDALHKDYRQYLGKVCHSMPFFTCLGNHEGESGYYLLQTPPENIAVYGTLWRKFYYPNPYPNGFYSGNALEEPYGIGLPENYYAWTWGDALFVVLDVYRDCAVNEKPQKWDWTIGQAQYEWFKQTLETSHAKFKFVFCHHLRGQGRGGKALADGFEWGGYDGGAYKFDQYRPGWAMPIHQLMVANGVNIFFQGHDHLYAREELDGMVYQEVPMAADSTYEIGVLANADAYTDLTLDGTGHLRVTVNPGCVTVDYIRAYLPEDTLSGQHHNGEIAYSYTVGPCAVGTQNVDNTTEAGFRLYPNPASDQVWVQTQAPAAVGQRLELLDIHGTILRTVTPDRGAETSSVSLSGLAPGPYLLRYVDVLGPAFARLLLVK